MNYLSLAPQLQQLFVIGDGKTSWGQVQQVIVPAGATRFVLATMDGFGWFNNTGKFNVQVTESGASGAGINVTHNLPAAGYTVDPATVSPPGLLTTATQFFWAATLPSTASGASQSTFQLTGTVDGMAPGEVRQISTGTSVTASVVTANGQQLETTLSLAPVTVAAEHIIGLNPPAQTADLGASVTYDVTLTDPLSTPVTYILAADELGDFHPGLAPTVTVNPGQTVSTPLTLTIPASEAAGTYGFMISATTPQGATDSVEGQLTVLPEVALPSQAVNLQLSPSQATVGGGTPATYTLTVTNVGDVTDTYNLVLAGSFPSGYHASAFRARAPDSRQPRPRPTRRSRSRPGESNAAPG